MKELDFDSIEIVDFKEFRGEHRLDLRKLGYGVHYVAGRNEVEPRLGSNGAGKSSIWDALCWCLYGRTASGLRGSDIKTWGSKAHAFVRVMVRIDGEKRLIVRSTKTNGLWIDGKVCDQKAIDDLVGMSYAIFPHAILVGQGQPLFLDLKPTAKMSLLSEALDLDRWESRSAEAKKAVQAIDRDKASMEGRCAELQRTAADGEQQLKRLEEKSEDWEIEERNKSNTRGKALADAKKALAHAEKTQGVHDLALDGAETEARATRKKRDLKEKEYSEAVATVGGVAAAVSVLMQNLADSDQEANEAGDTCRLCGQSLKGTALAKHRKDAKKKLAALEADLKVNRDMLSDLTKSRDKLREECRKLSEELRGFEDKADDARDGFTRAQAAVSDCKARIKQMEKEAAATEATLNPFSDLLKQAKAQARKIEEAQVEVLAIVALLEAKRARTHYWVQGFKNVRLYLLQEVLDELTGVAQTLLGQIGLEDWIIEFSMERETQSGKVLPELRCNIFKPGLEVGAKWENWSGGEAQRLRLVGAVALSQVLLRRIGVDCGLLILDEPTRHLSAQGVLEMIDFLIDLGRDYQIFYIDHAARETKRFASTLTVRKDVKGSRIEHA